MSRGGSDCCHYDEGYDDGYDDGKRGREPEREPVVEALRLLARERLISGDTETADFLNEIADAVAIDNGFERRIERERERQAEIVKLYAESRIAA